MKTVMAGMTLATILFIAAAADQANPSNENGTCIEHTKDVPAAQCICSMNCACAGRCIIEGGENATSCFIDCVLKNDCLCPAEDAPELPTEEKDDRAPPPSPLPATLDKTLKVTVARPKVSRSRQEKRRAEEALLIKVDVVGYGSVKFEVLVNDVYLDDFYALPGEGTANAIPLNSFLEEDIRADGDKTVVVSLVPRIQGKRVTVRDVRIVYQDK